MVEGIVISLEMIGSYCSTNLNLEMGDRGSKSDFILLISVKEQRVDGSSIYILIQ